MNKTRGKYDLHVHTNASDGLLSPAEVVKLAAEKKLGGIAITDHDSVSGVEEAIRQGNRQGIEVIPGVEVSSEYNGIEVHLLGYYLRFNCPKLVRTLYDLRQGRSRRMEAIIARLQELGVNIDFEEVSAAAHGGSIGRPHLARVMYDKGYVQNVREAFSKYLGRGRPAYVSREKLSPAGAIKLIRNAGGVAVLAHPGIYKNNNIIPALVNSGLQGLEVFYPEHSVAGVAYYYFWARLYGLAITGGSDFHGRDTHFLLGKSAISYRYAANLKN